MRELLILMLVGVIALAIAALSFIHRATDLWSGGAWLPALAGIICLALAAALLVSAMLAVRKGVLPTTIWSPEDTRTALFILTAVGLLVFGSYGLILLGECTRSRSQAGGPALVCGLACLGIETAVLIFAIFFLPARRR